MERVGFELGDTKATMIGGAFDTEQLLSKRSNEENAKDVDIT